MRRAISIACLALVLACASYRESRDTSLLFAEEWLVLLDAGDREGAWAQTSELSRLRYQKEETLKFWFGKREPFGKLVERKLQVNWERDWLDTAPDGIYRQITYWSEFENKDFVEEELLLTREDGVWKLLSYQIK